MADVAHHSLIHIVEHAIGAKVTQRVELAVAHRRGNPVERKFMYMSTPKLLPEEVLCTDPEALNTPESLYPADKLRRKVRRTDHA